MDSITKLRLRDLEKKFDAALVKVDRLTEQLNAARVELGDALNELENARATTQQEDT